MKYIHLTLIILVLSSFKINSQTNPLNDDKFSQIKFNNILFEDIEGADANVSQMNALFGNNTLLTAINESSPSLARDFWNNNITINFQDDSDTGNEFYVLRIRIKNENTSVTVNGVTARIGDHVSKFGDDLFYIGRPSNNNTGNVITVNNINTLFCTLVFVDALTETSSLAFKFDSSTDQIIDIEYNSY